MLVEESIRYVRQQLFKLSEANFECKYCASVAFTKHERAEYCEIQIQYRLDKISNKNRLFLTAAFRQQGVLAHTNVTPFQVRKRKIYLKNNRSKLFGLICFAVTGGGCGKT
jgi:hypothetical protein